MNQTFAKTVALICVACFFGSCSTTINQTMKVDFSDGTLPISGNAFLADNKGAVIKPDAYTSKGDISIEKMVKIPLTQKIENMANVAVGKELDTKITEKGGNAGVNTVFKITEVANPTSTMMICNMLGTGWIIGGLCIIGLGLGINSMVDTRYEKPSPLPYILGALLGGAGIGLKLNAMNIEKNGTIDYKVTLQATAVFK